MTARSAFIDSAVQSYIIETMTSEPPILQTLRAETQAMPNAQMQIGPDQGEFMQLLAKLLPIRRYLEIGVFTGYSSLAMALAMPDDGEIVACDVSEDYTTIARRHWHDAGIAEKIDLRLGPANTTIASLRNSGAESTFDCVFIDADKENVDHYYEGALALLRPNGIVLVDNVLWSGSVVDSSVDDAETRALRDLNAKAAADERVDAVLLPVGDGLLMARKR